MENHTSITTASSLSPSKRAIQILNATNGLLAHPLHHHSFTAIGGSSPFAPAAGVSLLSSPKCFIAGAFRKCAACRVRLGRRPHRYSKSFKDEDDEVSSSSSGMEMLYCVACGVYAHRSCAFAPPPQRPNNDLNSHRNDQDDVISMPGCEVNRPIIQSALGLLLRKDDDEPPLTIDSQKTVEEEVVEVPNHESRQLYWPFFGRRANDEHDNGDKAVVDDTQDEKDSTISVASTDHNNNMDECDNDKSIIEAPTEAIASWSFFSRSSREVITNNEQVIANNVVDTFIENSTHQRHNDSIETNNNSPKENSSSTWHFFRGIKVDNTVIENESNNNETADESSSGVQVVANDSVRNNINDNHSITSPRSEGPVVSWSIFRKTPSTITDEVNNTAITPGATESTIDESTTSRNQNNNADVLHKDDDLCHNALEDILTSDHDTAEDEVMKQPLPPPHGAFQSSIDIIQKTRETASNVPKAYSIGMVAGGVAGLAIAGPAG